MGEKKTLYRVPITGSVEGYIEALYKVTFAEWLLPAIDHPIDADEIVAVHQGVRIRLTRPGVL